MPSRELQRVLRQNDQLQILRAEDQQHIKDLTKQLASANERVRHYITKSDDLTKQLAESESNARGYLNALQDEQVQDTLDDLIKQLTELSEAVRALPVEEMVQARANGYGDIEQELLGYGMQCQGEWDRVRAALPPQEVRDESEQ